MDTRTQPFIVKDNNYKPINQTSSLITFQSIFLVLDIVMSGDCNARKKRPIHIQSPMLRNKLWPIISHLNGSKVHINASDVIIC